MNDEFANKVNESLTVLVDMFLCKISSLLIKYYNIKMFIIKDTNWIIYF